MWCVPAGNKTRRHSKSGRLRLFFGKQKQWWGIAYKNIVLQISEAAEPSSDVARGKANYRFFFVIYSWKVIECTYSDSLNLHSVADDLTKEVGEGPCRLCAL